MEIRNIKRLEAWDRLVDFLITTYYYRFRQKLKLPFDSLDNEPAIRFGGFVLEEPWIDEKENPRIRCGWHTREPHCRLGKLTIFTRHIYLNRLFLYHQLGLEVYYLNTEDFATLFNLDNFVKILAHELAHAILTDTQPKTQEINGGHGKEHDKVSEDILEMIENSKEYQQLKVFWK
jgi:hypothetical protein